MRLFLHVGAYWLMWSLRALMPRRSLWRVAQFDTLRLRLIKLAARVEVLKRKVRLHLPRATPDQAIFACADPHAAPRSLSGGADCAHVAHRRSTPTPTSHQRRPKRTVKEDDADLGDHSFRLNCVRLRNRPPRPGELSGLGPQ